MNLTANTILAGKLKLVRQLGEGGMGAVWVAEHLHLGRQVAVKVIASRVLSEPTMRERFETEARATAKVESPHVVQVLDFDYTDAGQPFLVLELLVGETLEDRIQREGPLTLQDAKELLNQTTHALTEAHQAGIFHRDIKAENLFLLARDELFVKLLDFGIALTRDRKSNPEIDLAELSPIGTPLYMAPEQTMMLSPVDERTDLYALGVVLYYALTGHFPYSADTLAVLGLQQQREEFKLPSLHRPDLAPAIDAFFLRALAFPPEERFQTATKMYEAFAKRCERPESVAVLSSRPVMSAKAALQSAPPPRSAQRTARSHSKVALRRRRRLSTVAVGAAIAVGGFFLAPRYVQTAATQRASAAAVWAASRIPSAQVAAATEESGPAPSPERSLLQVGSPIALPLPTTSVVVETTAATMPIATPAVATAKQPATPAHPAKSREELAEAEPTPAAPDETADVAAHAAPEEDRAPKTTTVPTVTDVPATPPPASSGAVDDPLFQLRR
ncbi:MAG: protein kinase [Polyangiaceae bacterium]